LLAQIHIGQKALGLDDDTYHDMLEATIGKDSAATMTVVELQRVVDHMRELGWQNERAAAAKAPRPWRPSDKRHVRKVWALWGAMAREGSLRDGSKQACRLFVERMTDCSDPEWLTPDQANKVIEGLKAIERRHTSQQAKQRTAT
jgi:phage gp16-like protein